MIFYIFAIMAIAFALTLIFKKNPVSSAFSLVMVFFSFAGIYAVLGAHLIAAMQIIVYTGAIMVLFIFVIMLLNADVPDHDYDRTPNVVKVAALAGSVALIGILSWVFHGADFTKNPGTHNADWIVQSGGNTQVLSEMLFSEYLLPFELTSVLLLVAIIGAVAIAKRKKKGAR